MRVTLRRRIPRFSLGSSRQPPRVVMPPSENAMSGSSKIAQAYGYAVCFIAVVTLLISSKGIVDATFDLNAPLRADRYMSGMSLTSFEAYKRDRIERRERPSSP